MTRDQAGNITSFSNDDVRDMLRRSPELMRESVAEIRANMACEVDRGPDADTTFVVACELALYLRQNGDTWTCQSCGAIHPWYECPDGYGCTALGCTY
jgi:hypothetical protein